MNVNDEYDEFLTDATVVKRRGSEDESEQPTVYFVPEYLADALTFAKLQLSDITVNNYENAMAKVSRSDMADMLAVMLYMHKNFARYTDRYNSTQNWGEWFLYYYYELTKTVPDISSIVIDDSLFANTGLNFEETYDIVGGDNATYVIVKNGFLGFISEGGETLTPFIKTLINTMFKSYGDTAIVRESVYFKKLIMLTNQKMKGIHNGL